MGARLPLAVTLFCFLGSDCPTPSRARRRGLLLSLGGAASPSPSLPGGGGGCAAVSYLLALLLTQLLGPGARLLGPSYFIGPTLHTSVQWNWTSCCSLSYLLVLAVLFPRPFPLFLLQALPLFTCTKGGPFPSTSLPTSCGLPEGEALAISGHLHDPCMGDVGAQHSVLPEASWDGDSLGLWPSVGMASGNCGQEGP